MAQRVGSRKCVCVLHGPVRGSRVKATALLSGHAWMQDVGELGFLLMLTQ